MPTNWTPRQFGDVTVMEGQATGHSFDGLDDMIADSCLRDRSTHMLISDDAQNLADYFKWQPSEAVCDGTQARITRRAMWLAQERGEDTSPPYWGVWFEQYPFPNLILATRANTQADAAGVPVWVEGDDIPASIRRNDLPGIVKGEAV